MGMPKNKIPRYLFTFRRQDISFKMVRPTKYAFGKITIINARLLFETGEEKRIAFHAINSPHPPILWQAPQAAWLFWQVVNHLHFHGFLLQRRLIRCI